jgi:hypothetical protein
MSDADLHPFLLQGVNGDLENGTVVCQFVSDTMPNSGSQFLVTPQNSTHVAAFGRGCVKKDSAELAPAFHQ